MRYASIVAALAACAVFTTCSGTSNQSTPPTGVIGIGNGSGGQGMNGGGGGKSSTDTVHIGNNFYSPSSTTVPVGTTVTWIWLAGDTVHTVTDNADTTIMSRFQSSGTYQRTFTTAGNFPYHCSVHGFVMSGTIIAQ